MRTTSVGVLVMVGWLFAAVLTGADEHFVATNGANVSPYTTWANAATNIQAAINAATAGDTVWVSNGVYKLSSYISITKNIALRGFKGQNETIIDGNRVTRCIYVAASTPACAVDGFTIKNGYVTAWPGGGGVLIYYYSRAAFSNCIITANESTNNLGGGGVYGIAPTTGTFVNCVISYNTARGSSGGSGGGVALDQGCLSNCYIIKNYAEGAVGGGISIGGTAGVTNSTIISCVITGNYVVANLGGGADCFGTRILNSLIAWNTSAYQIGGLRIDKNSYIGNCVINSNVALTWDIGALSIYSGNQNTVVVENCEIRGNSACKNGAVSIGTNDILRGCLIAENVCSGSVATVYSTTGYNWIQNCTIVSNRNYKSGAYSAGIYLYANNRMENTICSSNMDPTASSTRNYYPAAGCVINYSCTTPSAAAYGTGNTTNNPAFLDFAGSNYRLMKDSPCINTGSNQAWMSGAKDVDGNPRLDPVSMLVDMGAYEFVPTMSAVSGVSGGNVNYTYQIGLSEVRVSDYVSYLNAADTASEIEVSTGQVLKAGSSTPYCLTQAADTNAPVVYDSGLPAGQRFTAITSWTNHPIVFVSWFGAAAYCNWKSDQEGFVKVYDPAGGWTAALTNNGYRLPTEKEWRKATAWNSSSNSFYAYGTSKNTMTNTDANYLFSGDSYETNAVAACPVGSYTPSSPYAVKDASGNAWEWCQDFYNSAGYDADVDAHAVRGGSWGNLPTDVRAASRSGLKPGYCAHTVGFRVVRQAGQ